MFDDSALNRIVFVALLVNVERVILEAGNDIKDRLILLLILIILYLTVTEL